MGGYRCCDKCGEYLRKPTAQEDLAEDDFSKQRCPWCDWPQSNRMSLTEWIIDLDERLNRIEEKLEK
jgi:hypothetical protein